MAVAGYLRPFVAQMLWLGRNYSAVNVMPYGSFNGGYAGFREAVSGAAWPLRPFLLLCAVLPAVLPIVALAGWGMAFALKKTTDLATGRRFAVLYLLACMLGYIVSTYPRPDIAHLTTVAPLGYVLVTILICTCLKPAVRTMILLVMLPWCLMPAIQAAIGISAETRIPTPVGELRVGRDAEGGVRRLFGLVQPGQTLYVHPYLPLFYFLTQTSNPTRFSYLAPGMMTGIEEGSALEDLQRAPPQWILYLPLTREGFLRVFPSGKNLDHHFEKIETWIQANYAPLDQPLSIEDYQLLARRTSLIPAPVVPFISGGRLPAR